MERIRVFDYLKGICILIVVLCHTVTFGGISCEPLRWIFQAVFLNDFYFIAGWIQAQHISKQTISKKNMFFNKVIALLVPYALLSLVAIIYQAILVICFHNGYISQRYTGVSLIVRNIYLTLSFNGIGTLWFLPTLLIGLLSIVLLSNKSVLFNITTSVVSYLCYMFMMGIDTTLFNSIVSKEIEFLIRVFAAVSYCSFGYLFGKIWRYRKVDSMIGGVMVIIGLAIFSEITLIAVPLIAVGIPVLLLSVEEKIIDNSCLGILSTCGKHSILIMYIHYVIVLPIALQVLNYIEIYTELSTQLQNWILFFVVLFFTAVLSKIVLVNEYISMIFGKGPFFQKLTGEIKSRIFNRK